MTQTFETMLAAAKADAKANSSTEGLATQVVGSDTIEVWVNASQTAAFCNRNEIPLFSVDDALAGRWA